MKETITSCDRRPVCRWRVPQPNSALLPEVFVVRSSVCSAEVVGSNPNQAWNDWNAISGRAAVESKDRETIVCGIQRPYRPPPGLLGLIYRLSSGQEIPHFPSLGLFCHGKLHHLPNLRNIFMPGEMLSLIIVALRSWLVFHVGSGWFSLILKFSEKIHGLV